jgi:hypothetical protein
MEINEIIVVGIVVIGGALCSLSDANGPNVEVHGCHHLEVYYSPQSFFCVYDNYGNY